MKFVTVSPSFRPKHATKRVAPTAEEVLMSDIWTNYSHREVSDAHWGLNRRLIYLWRNKRESRMRFKLVLRETMTKLFKSSYMSRSGAEELI